MSVCVSVCMYIPTNLYNQFTKGAPMYKGGAHFYKGGCSIYHGGVHSETHVLNKKLQTCTKVYKFTKLIIYAKKVDNCCQTHTKFTNVAQVFACFGNVLHSLQYIWNFADKTFAKLFDIISAKKSTFLFKKPYTIFAKVNKLYQNFKMIDFFFLKKKKFKFWGF